MAQKKEESSSSSLKSLTKVPFNCWWSDQVLSPTEDNNQSAATPYRDFVLISEFSELEGPLPLAIVTETTYIDLKHYTNTVLDRSLQQDLKKIGLESFDFNSFVLRVVSVDRSTEYEQIDEESKEQQAPMTPSSLLEESQAPCLFSIPDDTQVYFTDSEHKFFAFTHHLTLFDINARGYVHPVALSYITRDPDKIVIRFEELMEKFSEVSIRMKKGNYSNFTLDLKCRLLDLEYTQSTQAFSANTTNNCNKQPLQQQQQQQQQQKPALSMQAIQQAITATKLMIDTLESSTSQINNMTSNRTTEAADTLRAERKKVSTQENEALASKHVAKEQHFVDPPKDYKPKCIDTLYPVAHFERKLRSLAQLCQEPDEGEEENKQDTEQSNSHIKRPSVTQKTAAMIPLVFSMIEPSSTPSMSVSSSSATTATITSVSNSPQRPTFANAITHDMYAEAIKYIQDMTHCLGQSSVVLDVNEEEELFLDPKSSALTFGRTFMLNMDNPQPREKEELNAPASPTGKDDEKERLNEEKSNASDSKAAAAAAVENVSFTDDEHHTHCHNEEELFYPILFAPTQVWRSESRGATKTHLLQVLRRYQSLVVDVIFSLLIGRTVIIQGSEKNKSLVQQVVQALSVFVPGQSRERNQVIEWFETAKLTDAQIKGIKLVGVDKNCMDPSIHVDSSCVLDIDVKNGSLNSSPVYVEGQWINQLLDRMMLFSSDESYLAYLHTVFMNISLKAFVYHHLYVCEEFKLDESPPPTTPSNSNKGYTSETGSESSTLSRKWSVRLMNYLKKHEDQESSTSTTASSMTSSGASSLQGSEDEEDEDYSEENQATVTLQSLNSTHYPHTTTNSSNSTHNKNKPNTIIGLFQQDGPTTATTTATPSQYIDHTTLNDVRRESISTTYSVSSRRDLSPSDDSSRTSSDDDDDEEEDTFSQRMRMAENASYLDFEADDLVQFSDTRDSDDSSTGGESEEDTRLSKEHEKPNYSRRRGKHKFRKPSDVGPDGVSFTERRGRRYLQEKLKVYGDDQTIVVYLATCVL
ncbi:uncharacterized protein ATC70_008330 [Mucor velutinosus]|uniref:UDENN FLCN/SMCR8-type domain-containing protein n=1 Tax=Mucor velutinosus TaxID=708070 RepID=A0AAN7DP62_9FUNG|nr:hypothetical protein ATC70_008330 [Mucor velutinosus]